MPTKRSNEITPPLVVIEGRQEPASYITQLVPEFAGNPLIEALPQLWTLEQVTELLSHYPAYTEEYRKLPAEIRLHMLDNAREFFIPQGVHTQIHISISNMLRRGYLARNPIERGYWKAINAKLHTFEKVTSKRMFLQCKARGFCIVGIGGVGKSTTVENILSLYPQVVVHTHYDGQDFILKQLVWLKIQCPNDGSIKGLCLNFFDTIDAVLGTKYADRYGSRRRTVDQLLPDMGRVAALHCLGMLVIDEIQDLSEAKSGGSTRVLNFLVQLENTIGVPYLLIGTPKANQLFRGEFRQARRASEQGDVDWQRMSEFSDNINENCKAINPIWEEFIRALWVYQYVSHPSPLQDDLLDDSLSKALYNESQGITAIAVTLYVLAQRRAISSGAERITAAIIHSVAKDSQNQISDYINQIRQGAQFREKGNNSATDLGNINFDPTAKKQKGKEPRNSIQSFQELDSDNLSEESSSQVEQAHIAAMQTDELKSNKKKVSARSSSGRNKHPKTLSKISYNKDDLRNFNSAKGGGEENKDIAQKNKHVRSATEFLD